MAKTKGSVRRGQIITTYGIGSVVAVEDESFMLAGIDRWSVSGPNVQEPRLERQMNVSGFVVPPASERGLDIPVVRFPKWCSCPACKRLDTHRFFTSRDRNECSSCGVPLVPSRFVVCCEHGHIDDFPYFRWLHVGMKSDAPDGKHQMRIEATGRTASLRDIVLSCSCGVPAASMEGAFGRNALKSVTNCWGKKPWLTGPDDDCDQVPRTLQRGASNVWFPVVRSALSIPPWSEGAYKILNRRWDVLRHIPDDDTIRKIIEGMDLAEGTPYSVEDLVLAVRQRRGREDSEGAEPDKSLKDQEHEALVNGKEEVSRKQDFVCVPAEQIDAPACDWFEQVMLVKRLREVRVLEAFSRVLPPSPADGAERRAPLYDSNPGWLPAIEVMGEGVFLRLNGASLAAWESQPEVRERAARVHRNYVKKFIDVGAVPDRTITARLLLVHTLAHALINQWSLDCGYPAASLRERLYVSDEVAGLLIYTATTDSAGSLGGVVAQADPGRLSAALLDALARSAWCSADPLCIEADAAGVDSLNLAGCHACVLLPETSCEEQNVILDRAMLVGTPEEVGIGFFAELLTAV